MSNLIERIEEMRLKQGWSRYELGRRCEISEGTMRNWGKGHEPSASAVVKVANALGVSVEYLLLGTNKEINLSTDEKSLIEKLRNLDERDKNAVDVLVSGLNDQYQQSGKKYINFESLGSVAEAETNNKLV